MKPALFPIRIALFVAVLLPILTPAQPTPAASTNASTAERFLVIVETSAAMQKRAENIQKAVAGVISSGLDRHMGYNSTIGVWTFNDKLSTGQLPLQLWTPSSRQRVALTLVQFLQQQKFEKIPRLPATWEAMTNVIAQSDRITVLLFTSGSDPIGGTPFDAAITESFIKNGEQQRKANMPFLTILRAVKGQVVAFAVNMPPWPLEVPPYPDGYEPVRPPQVAAETKPAPSLPKRPDPAILAATNTIYLAESSAPVEMPVLPAPPGKPEPTNPMVAAPTPPPRTNEPVVAPVATTPKPPQTPGHTPATETVASAEARTKFPIITILIAGISLLLGVMVVFIALLRWSRRSVGASLITRSMNKDGR
jgi:hypothetical protein